MNFDTVKPRKKRDDEWLGGSSRKRAKEGDRGRNGAMMREQEFGQSLSSDQVFNRIEGK